MKDPLKRYFLGIDQTRFFWVRNFGNTSAMRLIFFFWKCSKFKLDLKNGEKNSEKVFCFRGTCNEYSKGCHANFNNVWRRLPSCFPEDPLKRDFLYIDVTMFFGVRNFGNTSAMRVILFFSKCLKFKLDFKNAKKNREKYFFVFDILASELVPLNCLY